MHFEIISLKRLDDMTFYFITRRTPFGDGQISKNIPRVIYASESKGKKTPKNEASFEICSYLLLLLSSFLGGCKCT